MKYKRITAMLSGAAIAAGIAASGCSFVYGESYDDVMAAGMAAAPEESYEAVVTAPAGQEEYVPDTSPAQPEISETAAPQTEALQPDTGAQETSVPETVAQTDAPQTDTQPETTGTVYVTGASGIQEQMDGNTDPEVFSQQVLGESETIGNVLAEVPVETEEGYEGSGYSDGSYYENGSYWDPSWYFKKDFRFTQVDKQYALAEGERSNRIYEQPDQDSEIVGEVPYFGLVYVLKTMENWSYVESGNVRGFIPNSQLTQGSKTTEMVETMGEDQFKTATQDVDIADNKAFTYTQTTTQDVLVDKDSALVTAGGGILEYPEDKAKSVGEVKSGSLVYILEKSGEDWYYVESGDVRGFIRASNLVTGTTASKILDNTGNSADTNIAVETMKPEQNRSLYYTLKSTKPAASGMGENIADYAYSFAGKLPYVYGGTSLDYGADCSGFVQSVFSSFGINLPRTAQEQGASGEIVPSINDAQPGDVVYYGSGPHVGIYLGDGRIVECAGNSGNTAANPGKGVTIQNADYMPITSIRRYIILTDGSEGVSKTGSKPDNTVYTQEQMELIWAVVAQEDNGSYQGALAVISSAMNRTESARWSFEGGNALSQLTAPGQYCYSMDSYWKPRLHGNVPSYVKQAVYDCLKKGIRNHNYTSFRSTKGKVTGDNAVQIGGNWFFGN